MEKTTIQIHLETLDRLKALKNFERQSYDDVLNILINNSEEEILSEEEIEEIKQGLEDVKMGRTITFELVLKKRGIKLK